MRILMINSVCGVKSTGRICTDLARALESQGHEVKIAYGREEVPEDCARFAVSIGGKWDTYVHGLGARLLDGAGLGSAGATRRFLKWVREFDPDVVHLHNLHGYYLHVPMLLSYLKKEKKKVIWTLHDCWPFTGHSATCDETGCRLWETGCHHCPQRGSYPRSLTDRSAANWQWKRQGILGLTDVTAVCPSQWLAEEAKRSAFRRFPVTVIPNGIDTSAFRPMGGELRKELGLEGKRVILGVASTWNEAKGFRDFLDLARRVGEDTRIVLVGVTEAQKAALPEKIMGIPRTDSLEQLARLYSAADVFVNLTYCDTYPTVNLEALCCGTPVLTYRTGGSPECLREGWGAAAEKGDLDEILRLLPRVCAMKPDAEEARALFRRERATEAYGKLYRESL